MPRSTAAKSALGTISVFAAAAVTLIALQLVGTIPAAGASSVKAILEVDREVYYAGDPVPVRISLWNDGAAPVEAPGGEIVAGFELYDSDGKRVPLAQSGSSAAAGSAAEGSAGGSAASAGGAGSAAGAALGPARTLAAGAFTGYARDVTALFPRLKEPGTYRLQWNAQGIASNAVILRVVPRYDPEKDYSARVETDLGTFTLEFLRKDAPLAVKTFVELAQTGFYDGVIFHFVEPDRVVVSGDPTGTGEGGPGFGIPHERPQVKMLAGTVIMPAMGRPPVNGSIFAILLAPRPDLEGQATGFAQVVEGLDTVRKISQVPATPRDASQPHRPLKDLKINRVIIRPKA